MKYGLPVVCGLGKILVWAVLLLYVAIVLAGWMVVKAENSIHQCVFAAQVVAALLTGYIVGRCLVFMIDEIEKVIEKVNGKPESEPVLFQRCKVGPPPIPNATYVPRQ